MTLYSDTSNDHQPLFSCLAALYTLTLLYFPHSLRTSSLPLVTVLTILLLLLLLRLGSTQKEEEEAHKVEEKEENPTRTEISFNDADLDCVSGSSSFVGWDVGAPLEVIYEEDGGDGDHRSGLDLYFGSGRYPSLSSYYPETDSDSSSEGGGSSPEKAFFEWEAEDREESLIEIALNGHGKGEMDTGLGIHFEEEEEEEEEENWIEIDPVKKASPGFE